MKLRPRHRTGFARVLAYEFWGPGVASALFIAVALVLFAMSAFSPDMLQGVRSGTADLAGPALSTLARPLQAAADEVRGLSGLAALQGENSQLREENARLREWYQTAQALQTENQSLHNLLHIPLRPDQTYVTARVIADSGNAYLRSMLVLAGNDDGVQKGQAVLAEDGLIGRVIESGNRVSRVLLLTDINSRVPVAVEGTDIQAILSGVNGDVPQLSFLPQGAMLTEGARIVTSGQGGLLPYGLPVGTAAKAADGSWVVRPFADSARASYVRVVNSGEDPRLHEALPPAGQ